MLARGLPPQLPGVAAAAAVALAASLVATLHGGPQLLYALFFGIALNFLANRPVTKPGIEFSARTVLRLGVGLLGARITAEQVIGLGWPTALIVITAVASTLGLAVFVGRRLGIGRAKSVLAGGSVAICGASAALAIAAVLPREKDGERFTLMVVVSVTVLSTVAMVLYPLAVRALDLPPALGGLFLGGTIHDVAQVVGAGYTIDAATGDVATIVKLFRVALLAVVVAAVAWAFAAERAAAAAAAAAAESAAARKPARQPLLPWFLWLFVVLVAANSLLTVPAVVQSTLASVSRGCLVLAIAALGMKTSFMQLARLGWRPLALIVIETLWLALFVGAAVVLMR
jgi:uncharacterized integral membrane protein (TIGR00698 family)